MLSVRQHLLLLLVVILSAPGVRGAYYVDLPIDTPIGAAITAVFMTLIVVAVLSYFYNNLKEKAERAAGLYTQWLFVYWS